MKSVNLSDLLRCNGQGVISLAVVAACLLAGCASNPKYRPDTGRPASVKRSGGVYAQGYASYYGRQFHGKKTASGEIFNMYAMTAAHRTLPFGTIVEVENLKNGRKILVKINDRGPFVPGRILDLSKGAAEKLGMLVDGSALVALRIRKWGN